MLTYKCVVSSLILRNTTSTEFTVRIDTYKLNQSNVTHTPSASLGFFFIAYGTVGNLPRFLYNLCVNKRT